MLYCYFLWVAMLFKCFTCQCDVSMRSCCFLDRIQWIQCPLWITTKCIQKSPCSFTSVRLLVFVPVSPTFLLTALVKWEKKEKKWRTKECFLIFKRCSLWSCLLRRRLKITSVLPGSPPHGAQKDAVNILFYFRERQGYRGNLAVIFGNSH